MEDGTTVASDLITEHSAKQIYPNRLQAIMIKILEMLTIAYITVTFSSNSVMQMPGEVPLNRAPYVTNSTLG